jgi:hypothetical protein
MAFMFCEEGMTGFPTEASRFLEQYLCKVVRPTMRVLRALFPNLALPLNIVHYRDTDHGAYENDGNTPCRGTEYRAFYFVRLGGEEQDHNLEHVSYRNGSAHCRLFFVSDIPLRDSDNKLLRNSCSTEVAIAPYLIGSDVRNNCQRITYGPYIAALKGTAILRIVQGINGILDTLDLAAKVEKVMAEVES